MGIEVTTMASPAPYPAPLRKLTEEEAVAAFERAAHYYLGISGDEFLARWKRGEYNDLETPEATTVSMLIPESKLK